AAMEGAGRKAVPDAGAGARRRARHRRADDRWPRPRRNEAARAVHHRPAFARAARRTALRDLARMEGGTRDVTDPRNPQAQQMGDESMARNLAHQAQAIWPQEQRLFDRYGLEGPVRILDLGCGTGEITRRLADRYPQATLLGID